MTGLINPYKVEKDGAITNKDELLYEADSLEHLSREAKRRLAEIHSTMDIDYLRAERILIVEGLYKPND